MDVFEHLPLTPDTVCRSLCLCILWEESGWPESESHRRGRPEDWQSSVVQAPLEGLLELTQPTPLLDFLIPEKSPC